MSGKVELPKLYDHWQMFEWQPSSGSQKVGKVLAERIQAKMHLGILYFKFFLSNMIADLCVPGAGLGTERGGDTVKLAGDW